MTIDKIDHLDHIPSKHQNLLTLQLTLQCSSNWVKNAILDSMNRQKGFSYIHLFLIGAIFLVIMLFFSTQISNFRYRTINSLQKLVHQPPVYPEIIWKTKTSGYALPITSDEKNIYLTTSNGLYAIDGKTGQEIWKKEYGVKEIVPDDELVYVNDYKTLHALKKQDGSEVWKIEFKGLNGIIQITDSQIFLNASGDDGNYYGYAFSKDGKQNWKSDISLSSNLIINNKLYTAKGNYNAAGHYNTYDFYALNELNGEIVWKTEIGEGFSSKPVYIENLILLITYKFDEKNNLKNTLFALDANTGQILWKVPAGSIQSIPILAKGLIGLNTPGLGSTNNFIAFDINKREEKWKVPAPYGARVLVDNGTAYINGGNGVFVAVDSATGKQKWKANDYGNPKFVINNSLYILRNHPTGFDTSEYRLSILDTKTGMVKWRFNEGASYGDDLLKIGDTVYFYTKDYYLYAFR